MAVELITGEASSIHCTNSVDVFSMGILMWSLWTHEVPYTDEAYTPFMLMNKLVRGMRPAVPADVPARLAALMRQCWDKEPMARPSFSQVCVELEAIAGDTAQELVATHPFPLPAPPAARDASSSLAAALYTPPAVAAVEGQQRGAGGDEWADAVL